MKPGKKINSRFIKIAGWGLVTICFVLMGLYLSRNCLLSYVVGKRIRLLEQTYGLQIHYDALQIKDINEVVLQNLSVIPQERDTLLKLHFANIKLRLWAMLCRKIDVKYVHLDGLDIHFIKKDSIANYDFLFIKKKDEKEPEKEKNKDYVQRTNELLSLVFGFLPSNGELNRVQFTEQRDSNFVSIILPTLSIKENQFQSNIEVLEDTFPQHWTASGELNHSTHTVKVELYTADRQPISLPYIPRRFGAEVTFDTLSCSLTRKETSQGINLNGEAKISGLTVYHKALSPERINLNKGQLTYCINVGRKSLELDSTTTVTFNKLSFHPYLHAEKKDKDWHLITSINKSWFPADELFGSLPKGLFNNLEGIKTSGQLACHFLLDVDFALLDSLKFESELKEKDFRIVQYGVTNLGKMSGEFLYTAYENSQPVRTFPVGPSWEHFTPLDSISPLLQMSVMQSEDGAFYYHRGFLPDAMREALIYDLKVKRFARGGSTITMQLIKNVFLTRKKNFARKLEEALIVWLIETERLTSKERMYEVYLNIAEWGPMVYGIHEAADFYFQKRPSQLTVEECIFLSSIIPKPKHFRNSFTENMKLKENLEGYYRLISNRLAKKGLISENEAEHIQPKVEIKGDARQILSSPKDSIREGNLPLDREVISATGE